MNFKYSAYMIFSEMNRDEIKRTNPKLSFGSIGKQIDSAWKNLPIEEKDMYEKISEFNNKQLKIKNTFK